MEFAMAMKPDMLDLPEGKPQGAASSSSVALQPLRRSPGGPARRRPKAVLRQRASFWVSVGAVVFLLILQVAWTPARDMFTESSAKSRRLTISEVYPDDFVLTKPYYEDSRQYLLFLHCIGIGYMLLGLNTVCDVYFTGAIDILVDVYKIKPDVAGATFMAAGGSMPELFTSLIGVTVESDVGFSTIVGSAVFNILFVIGACGYVAKGGEIQLTWYPLFRDCTYYIMGLGLLAAVCYDKKIEMFEAALLFVVYLLYCVLMYFNTSLEALVSGKKSSKVSPEEGVAGKKSQEESIDDGEPPEATPEATPEVAEGEDGDKKEGNDGDDEDDEPWDAFMTKPTETKDLVIWYICLPMKGILYYLIPEPSEKWFIFTFIISLAWIAGFTFVGVWCVEILGDVIFKGDNAASVVMGFTVLAAGTSIPDAVSSMAVARKGEGDMAVSSSIGSNIFDILFGLPVPWMIKIAFVKGKSYVEGTKNTVNIQSDYIFFYVLLLCCMVFLTITSIHLVGWKLNRSLGACMAGLYVGFLVIALVVELKAPTFLQF